MDTWKGQWLGDVTDKMRGLRLFHQVFPYWHQPSSSPERTNKLRVIKSTTTATMNTMNNNNYNNHHYNIYANTNNSVSFQWMLCVVMLDREKKLCALHGAYLVSTLTQNVSVLGGFGTLSTSTFWFIVKWCTDSSSMEEKAKRSRITETRRGVRLSNAYLHVLFEKHKRWHGRHFVILPSILTRAEECVLHNFCDAQKQQKEQECFL